MAGLFDSMADPIAAAQAKVDAATQAQNAQLVAQLQAGRRTSPWGVAAQNFGVAFGRGLGRGLTGYEDPAVTEAKKQAQLYKGLQGLTDKFDPASSEYAKAAAGLALKLDRPDVAFQLSQAAGARAKSEATTAAKVAQQERENFRTSWSAQDTNSKLALLSTNPDVLDSLFGPGQITPKDKERLQRESQASLDTLRAKNLKALNDIKPVKTNPVTAQDVKNTMSVFTTNGLSPAGWNGFGKDELDSLANTFAQQAQSEQDAAGSAGNSLSLPAIQSDLLQKAIEDGAVQTREVYGPGTGQVVTGIDKDKLNKLFESRVTALSPKKPDTKADTQAGTKATGNEVVRVTADGRKAVFDAGTKQFIRWE